jgi:hypothetical protein
VNEWVTKESNKKHAEKTRSWRIVVQIGGDSRNQIAKSKTTSQNLKMQNFSRRARSVGGIEEVAITEGV